MFVDTLEVSLTELSMKYDEEKENNRKLREKLIKVEKGRVIEKRRVKYYQCRHLQAKKASMNRFNSEGDLLENITTATKESSFELIELD